MFNTITSLLERFQEPLKLIAQLIVTIIGIVFVVPPIMSAVSAVKDGNWGAGIEGLARIVFIAIIAVSALVGINSLGKATGSDLNTFIGEQSIPMIGSSLFYLGMKFDNWKNKKRQLSA